MKKRSKIKEANVEYKISLGEFVINDFYHGDSLELLPKIPSKTIDLVIKDPPFGIDFKHNLAFYNRKSSNVISGYKEIKKENYYEFSVQWISECYRVLKDN